MLPSEETNEYYFYAIFYVKFYLVTGFLFRDVKTNIYYLNSYVNIIIVFYKTSF
jgi:hypothetical protein